jgi:Tol biopolymer transport system component
MWFRRALCVVFCGCGFQSRPGNAPGDDAPGGDAPGSDASVDAGGKDAGDGPPAGTDCFQRWFDGAPSLALSGPQEITALSGTTEDRDPWISTDGLRLYFARNPGSHGRNDIYLASRSTTTGLNFGNLDRLDNLNTDDEETRASLSGDEKLLVFSGDHDTSDGRRHVFVTSRDAMQHSFPSPAANEQHVVAGVNTSNVNDLDPFITTNGMRLYLAPAGDPPAVQQITMASRSAADQDFGSSDPVPVINSPDGEADPALSADERIIVFSSHRASGVGGIDATNLWYATRPNAMASFTAPRLIPAVNGGAEDGDPMLSNDGCELYFASTRNGGKYHVFHAQVTK